MNTIITDPILENIPCSSKLSSRISSVAPDSLTSATPVKRKQRSRRAKRAPKRDADGNWIMKGDEPRENYPEDPALMEYLESQLRKNIIVIPNKYLTKHKSASNPQSNDPRII